MTDILRTISPVDGRIYVERPLETPAGIDRALDAAQPAQRAWASLTLAARCAILDRAVDAFVAKANDLAAEITWQMGRPIRHSPGEIRGFEERARFMLQLAPEALAAVQPGDKAGFQRQIKRVPLGIVAVVAPWNYPYLTAVNAVLPALIAGNAVVLKASHQTPLCAERFLEAFASAGLPAGVFQYLHLSHADTARLMGDRRVAGVCFTGSVSGGRAVVAATAAGFATSGLELGGKDPAYVRADADLAHAIDTLTDGAFYNAGQSCCGIKRIYVAAPRYEEFVAGVVDLTRKYRLGSPLDPETTLGPVVRTSAAEAVRAQVREAVSRGARQLIDETWFAASAAGTPYLAPQVLVDVDHSILPKRCGSREPSSMARPYPQHDNSIHPSACACTGSNELSDCKSLCQYLLPFQVLPHSCRGAYWPHLVLPRSIWRIHTKPQGAYLFHFHCHLHSPLLWDDQYSPQWLLPPIKI